MPPRILLPPRNRLAFPRHPAGFDPTHPGALGFVPGRGASVVASGANFINILNGAPLIPTSLTSTIDGRIGQVAICTTVGANALLSGLGVVVSTDMTYAAIFVPTSVASNTMMGYSSSALLFNGANFGCFFGGFYSSSTTYVQNVPYFYVASIKGSVIVNFVVVNLATGQTSNSTAAASTNNPNTIGSVVIGNSGAGGNQLLGNMATAMMSPVYVPMSNLLAWAADPWSFWYPPPLFNVVGATAPPASQFITFTQVGAAITRRIQSVGY